MFFILVLYTLFIPNQEGWKTYFQNKKIEISYRSKVCDDKKNGFSFEYYIIRVENKTNETFVINFILGKEEKENDEDKIAFVLNPNETKTGTCDYNSVNLKMFKSENRNNYSKSKNKFALTKIDVIEVY